MKANLITETNTYVSCSHCGEKDNVVSHLFDDRLPSSFGPWYCDSCGGAYKGTVKKSKEVTIEIIKDDGLVKTYVLLEIPLLDKPVYFITEGIDFNRRRIENGPHSNDKYFYNEHTCPTNWLTNVKMMIYEGDTDPHGLARYVATVDQPENDPLDDASDVWTFYLNYSPKPLKRRI